MSNSLLHPFNRYPSRLQQQTFLWCKIKASTDSQAQYPSVPVQACAVLRSFTLSPQDRILFQASSHMPKQAARMPVLALLQFNLLCSHGTPQKGHRMYGPITNSVPIAPAETKPMSFCNTKRIVSGVEGTERPWHGCCFSNWSLTAACYTPYSQGSQDTMVYCLPA